MLNAHLEPSNFPVRRNLKRVAENCGPPKLFHQRSGKLCKGIADDNNLRHGAQRVQKFPCTGQRIDFCNGLLNGGQPQSVLLQNAEAPPHQFIIIGLIPRGALQFRNAAGLRERNPDFRHQNAFQIQTNDVHCPLSSQSCYLK